MASDNFNRADANPIDGGWVAWGSMGACEIASQKVQNAAHSDTDSGCKYSLSNASSSRWRITSVVSRDGGPGIHCSGDTGYLSTGYDNINVELYRLDGPGSFFFLGRGACVYAIDDQVRLFRQGNDIVFTRNGVEIVRVADTTYNAGNPGGFFYGGGFAADDFTDDVAPVLQAYFDRTGQAINRPGRGPRSTGRFKIARDMHVYPLVVPQPPTPVVELNYDRTGLSESRPGRGPRSLGRFYIRQKMDVAARVSVVSTFQMETGSVEIGSSSAAISSAHNFQLQTASVSIAGGNALLSWSSHLTLQPAAVAISGLAASISAARPMSLSTGALVIAGSEIAFHRGYLLQTSTGAVVIAGGDLDFQSSESEHYTLECETGAVAIAGGAISFRAERHISLAQGSLLISGSPLQVGTAYMMALQSGSYSIAGAALGMLLQRQLSLVSGSYSIAGSSVSIRASLTLALGTSQVAVAGGSLNFLLGQSADNAWTVRLSSRRRTLRLTPRGTR